MDQFRSVPHHKKKARKTPNYALLQPLTLPQISAFDLASKTRHTFASTLLSAGENALYVATQMGHKGTEMINKHYGRWIEQGSENETRQQAAALFAKVSPKSVMPKLKPA